MNRQETQPNSASTDRMLEVSAAQKVQTIAGQFAARGVAKAVAETKKADTDFRQGLLFEKFIGSENK